MSLSAAIFEYSYKIQNASGSLGTAEKATFNSKTNTVSASPPASLAAAPADTTALHAAALAPAAASGLAPIAVDDEVTTSTGNTLFIDRPLLLFNDSDPENDAIGITKFGTPAHGQIINEPFTNVFLYKPNPGFTGDDTFTYTIADFDANGVQGTESMANVTVHVVAPDTTHAAPVAGDDSLSATVNTALVIDNVLLGNDDDADSSFAITSFTNPTHGHFETVAGETSYIPDTDFTGTDTFTYTITDPDGLADTATVTIEVTAATVDNTPPTGTDKTFTLKDTATLALTAADFGLADADAGDSVVSVVIETVPSLAEGVLKLNGVTVSAGDTISVVSLAQLVFVPVDGTSNYTTTITFSAVDSTGATSLQTSTLTIAVTNAEANVAPSVTAPGTASVGVGTSATLGAISIADSDAFSDSEVLTVVLSDAHGKLTATAVGGKVTGSGTNTIVINGTLSEVNLDLATLHFQSDVGGHDTIQIVASDGRGGLDSSKSIDVTVSDNSAPLITAPGSEDVTKGVSTAVGGIHVTDPNAVPDDLLTVVLSDTLGSLSATAIGGSVTGNGSHTLTVIGTLGEINLSLATLHYLASDIGTDQLFLLAADSHGATSLTSSIAFHVTDSTATNGGTSPNSGLSDQALTQWLTSHLNGSDSNLTSLISSSLGFGQDPAGHGWG